MPVRFVRLVVLNVGEAVVQILVLVVFGFVVFVLVSLVGFRSVGVGVFWVGILVQFVLGYVDGRRFQGGHGWTRG